MNRRALTVADLERGATTTNDGSAGATSYGRHFADAVTGRPDPDVDQLRGGFSRRDFIPPRHAEAGI